MDVGCSRTAALGSQLSKYSTKNSGRMLLALSTYRIPDVNAGSIVYFKTSSTTWTGVFCSKHLRAGVNCKLLQTTVCFHLEVHLLKQIM